MEVFKCFADVVDCFRSLLFFESFYFSESLVKLPTDYVVHYVDKLVRVLEDLFHSDYVMVGLLTYYLVLVLKHLLFFIVGNVFFTIKYNKN